MINGEKLKALRKERNITIEELANLIGVSPKNIESWENEKTSPDADILITMSSVLECSLDDFFDSEDLNESVDNENKFLKYYKNFPYPLFIVIIYLLLGFYMDLWHPGWLVFLTIPIYYTMDVFFIPGKAKSGFCFPILIVIIYLFFGFVYNAWHPTWIIFLLIPVFYSIVK